LIPTDEQRALQEAARRFAREQLLPLYQKREREARMDRALLRELGQLGFIGMDVSTKNGGMGCDAVTTGLVIEALSYGDFNIG
jgi:cyclohexanecarboxyl-CoA dehydrogenase